MKFEDHVADRIDTAILVWPVAALILASGAEPEPETEPETEPEPPSPEQGTGAVLSQPSLAQLPTTEAEMQRRLVAGTICRVVSTAAVTRDLEVNAASRVVATLQKGDMIEV